MADRSIGFIETFGLAACVAAADAAVKSANVKLLGFEYAKGDGMCTVKVEGNVGACKAAIEAGKKAAEMVNGSLSGTKSVLLKARPEKSMRKLLVDNRETVGGEIALAEGYRPAGDTKKPVLVKNWKPKEEPKAEAPMKEEAPEPPVVEDLTEESEKEAEVTDEQPEVVTQPEENNLSAETESVAAPEADNAAVVAPEEISETESPAEEAPVEESDADKAPEEDSPAEEVNADEAEAPKKKTSTGNRRSGRSRRKKNTDKTEE